MHGEQHLGQFQAEILSHRFSGIDHKLPIFSQPRLEPLQRLGGGSLFHLTFRVKLAAVARTVEATLRRVHGASEVCAG